MKLWWGVNDIHVPYLAALLIPVLAMPSNDGVKVGILFLLHFYVFSNLSRILF